MGHTIGERVIVSHKGRAVRGWLQQADAEAVVVRLPSLDNPESPGDEVEAFVCPPKPRWTSMTTCTSVYDHYGISIGYVDPTWSRTEESAREFSRFMSRLSSNADDERHEKRVKHMRRVRELSLAVPLQDACIWNDHGRYHMHEQATRELEAEAGTLAP